MPNQGLRQKKAEEIILPLVL